MDLEFHQIELRYEALRTRSATREARLLASLAEGGQQVPVVVVTSGEHHRYVLVDGCKRVRALRRLGRDTVRAMAWDLAEAEALLVERLMRSGDGAGALEEGWLLAELRDRFGMTVEELGKRFDRSASWVSRRLGLVSELPLEIQEPVAVFASPRLRRGAYHPNRLQNQALLRRPLLKLVRQLPHGHAGGGSGRLEEGYVVQTAGVEGSKPSAPTQKSGGWMRCQPLLGWPTLPQLTARRATGRST